MRLRTIFYVELIALALLTIEIWRWPKITLGIPEIIDGVHTPYVLTNRIMLSTIKNGAIIFDVYYIACTIIIILASLMYELLVVDHRLPMKFNRYTITLLALALICFVFWIFGSTEGSIFGTNIAKGYIVAPLANLLVICIAQFFLIPDRLRSGENA